MPPELRELLLKTKASATSEFVAISPRRSYLPYDGYLKALKRYCEEVGITIVSTHGLRHSTAEIWQEQGASRDDIQKLMAHSSSKITDRYIHNKGNQLEKVAKVIKLFPNGDESNLGVSQKVSQMPLEGGGR